MFLPNATMTAIAKAKGRSSFGNAGGRSSWKRVSTSACLVSAPSPEAGSGHTGHAGGRLRQGHPFFYMRIEPFANSKRTEKSGEVRGESIKDDLTSLWAVALIRDDILQRSNRPEIMGSRIQSVNHLR